MKENYIKNYEKMTINEISMNFKKKLLKIFIKNKEIRHYEEKIKK